MSQTESALRICERFTSKLRKAASHPVVHPAAQPGHGIGVMEPISGDKLRAGCLRALEKSWNVIRGMLTIAIHCEHPGKTFFAGALPAGPQRGAFAAICAMANHFGER